VWYLLLFAAVWILFKKFWIALLALLVLPLTLLLDHNAKALGSKLMNRIRKLRLQARRDPLYAETVALRRDIMNYLEQI
jgi:hypothetical protein